MLYCNNISSSSCIIYLDLSSFSFPFLNSFLVNYVSSATSISQAICKQRLLVCTCTCMYELNL